MPLRMLDLARRLFRRSVRRPGPVRLRVEDLEDRTVPATVVHESTYSWASGLGDATVTVTVTHDAAGYGDLYLWNYHVKNESYVDEIGVFALDVGDPEAIENLGNNFGWNGYVGLLYGDPSMVSWHAPDEVGPLIAPTEAANFWFTTPTFVVGTVTGFVSDSAFVAPVAGPAVGPQQALPVVTVENVSNATEGGADGVFRFTRTGNTNSTLTVSYTVGGTATPGTDFTAAGMDYTARTGIVTFAAGAPEAYLSVVAQNDTSGEGTETIELALRDDAAYTVARPSAAAVRLLDDDVPSVSVRTERDAGEAASEPGRFTFTREGGDLSQPLTISLTVGGEATEGTDYSPLARSVVFNPGENTATLDVFALNDADFELPEYAVVRIVEVPGYLLTADYAAGVVVADDEVGSIGGTVWEDLDPDGIREPDELPAAGVGVVLRDAVGNWLRETVTAANGGYTFTSLAAGTYIVDFNPPYGFLLTEAGVGADESADSDADPYTTWSAPVTIAGGQATALVSAGQVQVAPPPRPVGTKVIIVDSRGNEFGAGQMRVAKWTEAFSVVADAVRLAEPVQGLDFIDRDGDHFRVKVHDPARWTAGDASVDVSLKTLNAALNVVNDAPTTIRLVKDAAVGWYVSDTMILVSSTDDDTFPAPAGHANRYGADEAGPDNTKTYAKGGVTWWTSDRTHRIKLGETVSVEYVAPGGPATHTAAARADTQKVVKLRINVLKDQAGEGGKPAVTREELDRDIARMREMYARVGIWVETDINFGANPPQLVKLTDGLEPRVEKLNVVARGPENTKYMEVAPSFEQLALLGDGTLHKKVPESGIKDTSYLHVYYVPRFSDDQTIGESIPSAVFTGEGSVLGANTVMISGQDRNYGTLAHEVFHVLENHNVPEAIHAKGIDPTHFPYTMPERKFEPIHTVNLMVTGAGSRRPAVSTITDSIRLTPEQQARVYGRVLFVKDPQ